MNGKQIRNSAIDPKVPDRVWLDPNCWLYLNTNLKWLGPTAQGAVPWRIRTHVQGLSRTFRRVKYNRPTRFMEHLLKSSN